LFLRIQMFVRCLGERYGFGKKVIDDLNHKLQPLFLVHVKLDDLVHHVERAFEYILGLCAWTFKHYKYFKNFDQLGQSQLVEQFLLFERFLDHGGQFHCKGEIEIQRVQYFFGFVNVERLLEGFNDITCFLDLFKIVLAGFSIVEEILLQFFLFLLHRSLFGFSLIFSQFDLIIVVFNQFVDEDSFFFTFECLELLFVVELDHLIL